MTQENSNHSRDDDQDKARYIAQEHQGQEPVCSSWRPLELFPNEDAPEGSGHRGPLTQSIRNRKACLTGGNQVGEHSKRPDHTPEQSEKMIVASALEVSRQVNRFADEWLFHDDRIEYEITCQDTKRHEKEGRVRA